MVTSLLGASRCAEVFGARRSPEVPGLEIRRASVQGTTIDFLSALPGRYSPQILAARS
jgi:hypothetical protein